MELDEYGRLEWDRAAGELRRLGVLQKTDLSALAAYCRSASVVNSVGNVILENGLHATIGAGRGRRSALKVYNEAVTTFVRLATEFGFTPCSRSRVAATPEQAEDEMKAFLERKALILGRAAN
jgi:P27 family predicted phage terminase small subunit